MREPRWEWEDVTAPPNGIGPVCKYCVRLIDGMWDHSAACPAFVAKTDPTGQDPWMSTTEEVEGWYDDES